jgi:hypothetical protein
MSRDMKRNNMNDERNGCQANRRGIFSSRAHSCVELATGAGAADSAGGNGCSSSSLLIESALSRTGLIGVLFAGEVDSVCWVECDEACGMLRLEIRIGSTRKPQGNTLLRIGDGGTNSTL